MLYYVFCALAIVGAVAFVTGLVTIMLDTAFDFKWGVPDWLTIRPLILGAMAIVIFGGGAYFTQPGAPLSRGIVGSKEHRSYTAMVMVGKIFVPQHVEEWRLISTENATCDVSPESYDAYRAGDAVVCAWH